MSGPFEEGPVCDFCEIAVDEGETLNPIFAGRPPSPDPHRLRAIGPRGGYQRSREAGKLSVLRQALHDCADVELRESDVVHELEPDFEHGASQFPTDATEEELTSLPNPTDYRTRRTEKVGVNIRITPKDVDYDPDAMVCDTCFEMFKGLGDE